jgi:ribosomal protein L40E
MLISESTIAENEILDFNLIIREAPIQTPSCIRQSLITIRELGHTLPKLLLCQARLKLLLSHFHVCKTCGNRYPQDNVPEICDHCGYKLRQKRKLWILQGWIQAGER